MNPNQIIVPPTTERERSEIVTSPAYCGLCAHYNGRERRCTAFPNGIPLPIYNGSFDHRRSFDGDGGVKFKAADPVDEGFVDLIVQQNQGGK